MKTQFDQYSPTALGVVGEMTGADEIIHPAIFLGTYPGLTPAMLAHEIAVIRDFVVSRASTA
jgi:CDP-4-dehydro-6-deoxyglucose reductase, E1